LFTGRLGLTMLFSVLIWFSATLFFFFFGKFVLVNIGSPRFIPILLVLEVATAILLFFVMIYYKKIDTAPYSSIKLGVYGTAIGLFLDTFILCYSSYIFPELSSQQISSLIIWMFLAYAIYLIIPVWVEHFLTIKHKRFKS